MADGIREFPQTLPARTVVGNIRSIAGQAESIPFSSFLQLSSLNYLQGGAGSVTRSLQSRLQDVVSILDFGAVGDGSTDNTAAFAAARNYAAALSAANQVKIVFPAGQYNYATSPNWAITGLQLEALGPVVLNCTGSGNALILDGGTPTGGVFNMRVGRFRVKCGTGHAIFCRAFHHSYLSASIAGAGTSSAGLLTNFCVTTVFEISCTTNDGTFSSVPANGILLDLRGGGEFTTACTFINPVIEAVSGSGIKIVNGQRNKFLGGTSESNNRGIEIASGTAGQGNTFYGIDLESNAVEDCLNGGFNCGFYDINSAGTFHIATSQTLVTGGLFNNLTIDAGQNDNVLISTGITGTLTDNGNNTSVFLTRDGSVFRTYFSTAAPVTETNATRTVKTTDLDILCNRAGTVTLTLLAASSYTGKMLRVQTLQNQTVVSASSNVAPLGSATPGTAILAGTAGKWAELKSDGTNWIITAGN